MHWFVYIYVYFLQEEWNEKISMSIARSLEEMTGTVFALWEERCADPRDVFFL